ncbi:MAG: hypothetical protein KC931_26455, partial [Candidatus Omnitrophica bacterium]|nr:hypothetical protein [Candidatus Omnitrophota bacterium]
KAVGRDSLPEDLNSFSPPEGIFTLADSRSTAVKEKRDTVEALISLGDYQAHYCATVSGTLERVSMLVTEEHFAAFGFSREEYLGDDWRKARKPITGQKICRLILDYNADLIASGRVGEAIQGILLPSKKAPGERKLVIFSNRVSLGKEIEVEGVEEVDLAEFGDDLVELQARVEEAGSSSSIK